MSIEPAYNITDTNNTNTPSGSKKGPSSNFDNSLAAEPFDISLNGDPRDGYLVTSFGSDTQEAQEIVMKLNKAGLEISQDPNHTVKNKSTIHQMPNSSREENNGAIYYVIENTSMNFKISTTVVTKKL